MNGVGRRRCSLPFRLDTNSVVVGSSVSGDSVTENKITSISHNAMWTKTNLIMRRLKTVKFRWNFAFFLFRVIRIVSTSSQRVSSDLLFGNEMICQTPGVPTTISLILSFWARTLLDIEAGCDLNIHRSLKTRWNRGIFSASAAPRMPPFLSLALSEFAILSVSGSWKRLASRCHSRLFATGDQRPRSYWHLSRYSWLPRSQSRTMGFWWLHTTTLSVYWMSFHVVPATWICSVYDSM